MRKGWRHLSNGTVVALLFLVCLRAVLPIFVQRYVNDTLDRLPNYDGQIGNVDLALIRGAYTIDDVRVVKTTGRVPEPLFSAAQLDFSVQWKALLEGKWVGELAVNRGAIAIINGTAEDNSQTELSEEWLGVIKDLFPLRINRFVLTDSKLVFRDTSASPPVDIVLTSVEAEGRNFSNTRSSSSEASINGNGLLERRAPVTLRSTLTPSADKPTFSASVSLRRLPIRSLNDLLQAYGGVDAESGELSIFLEIHAQRGRLSGYLKPLIKDLRLIDFDKEKESFFGVAWEALVAALSEIFENQRHQQIGTVVAVEGTLDNVETSTFEALAGILRNAFIEAFKPGWEAR